MAREQGKFLPRRCYSGSRLDLEGFAYQLEAPINWKAP